MKHQCKVSEYQDRSESLSNHALKFQWKNRKIWQLEARKKIENWRPSPCKKRLLFSANPVQLNQKSQPMATCLLAWNSPAVEIYCIGEGWPFKNDICILPCNPIKLTGTGRKNHACGAWEVGANSGHCCCRCCFSLTSIAYKGERNMSGTHSAGKGTLYNSHTESSWQSLIFGLYELLRGWLMRKKIKLDSWKYTAVR